MQAFYLTPLKEKDFISQRLLFDVSPLADNFTPDNNLVPASFHEKGYTLLGGFQSLEDAHDHLYRFVRSIHAKHTAFMFDAPKRMQLAKLDLIPLCHEITSTGFQALHYDMGQPFLDEQPQTLYTVGALYRPLGSRNPDAKTRIVSIPRLLKQASFGEKRSIESRLLDYIRRFGDGWTNPEPVNTHRLACFARVVDAVSGLHSLCEQQDTMIGQCFAYDTNLHGSEGLRQEQEYFAKAGLHLTAAEEQIEIKPGQMLVYDNMRTVHGRIGRRNAKELFNFLFGIRTAKFEDISHYRQWLCAQFSSENTT